MIIKLAIKSWQRGFTDDLDEIADRVIAEDNVTNRAGLIGRINHH